LLLIVSGQSANGGWPKALAAPCKPLPRKKPCQEGKMNQIDELKERLIKSRQEEDIRQLIEALGLAEAMIWLFDHTNWR
jgi:hypothetical protein